MTTNKPEVKRYDPYGYDGMSALMHEDDMGGWVRTENYEALQAECEKLREDAERYRYLADECCAEWRGEKGPVLVHATPWTCNWRVELDAAIDAAMEKTK